MGNKQERRVQGEPSLNLTEKEKTQIAWFFRRKSWKPPWMFTPEGLFTHEGLKNNAPKQGKLFWADTSELLGLLYKVAVPRTPRRKKETEKLTTVTIY